MVLKEALVGLWQQRTAIADSASHLQPLMKKGQNLVV